MEKNVLELFHQLLEYEPEAMANIKGSRQYPNLKGTILFYPFWHGSLVFAGLSGLPDTSGPCTEKMYAFHIHEGKTCTGTKDNPFSNAGTHFNPRNCPHPAHAGDLPVLLSNKGIVLQMFYTERFTPQEVLGRTAVIHLNPDDFHTQPSGNAGAMIGCGEIKRS